MDLILLSIFFSTIIGICFGYVSYYTAYKIEKKKKFKKIETDDDKTVRLIDELIYKNAIKSFIEKHNYKLEECEIKYEIIDTNKVLVKIRPIKEVVEYTLDITIE